MKPTQAQWWQFALQMVLTIISNLSQVLSAPQADDGPPLVKKGPKS